MKILIISYFYYPENTPRAFRTHELVKEFLKRNYTVDLVLPAKEIYKTKLTEHPNLKIFLIGKRIPHIKGSTSNKSKLKSKLKDTLKPIYNFFNPLGDTFSYANAVYKFLKNRNISYRIIFSISFPFSVHLGLARALKTNKILNGSIIKIAEYSDPFYFQKSNPMFIVYKYLDLWIGKVFDYIVIPTEKAISTYKDHTSLDRIKVIPQGFDFEEVEILPYKRNDIPTFAYAGIFYKKIRNPDFLLNYLTQCEKEFHLIVYSPSNNTDTMQILDKYKKQLKHKLTIIHDVPRLELIKELSKMDFLINIDNITINQTPSKLIDYCLSERPIYSFNQNSFSPEKLDNYFSNTCDEKCSFDIESFNIVKVVDTILSLKDVE